MLTLEQAINDLMDASRTIAEVAESESDEANRINAQNVADDCKQIAELLRELQERRKTDSCEGCVKEFGKGYLLVCTSCKRNYADLYEPERRTE